MSGQRNEVVYDKDFLRDVSKLPREVQDKIPDLLEVLEEDAFHSLLHTKPLSAPLQGMFTFRITRDWRIGFKFKASHVIQLLAVDRRDKIYNRLARKP